MGAAAGGTSAAGGNFGTPSGPRHPGDVRHLPAADDGVSIRRADNGQMVEQRRLTGWARRVTALVRASSERRVLGGTSYALDVCIAAAATIAAVVAAIGGYLPTVTRVVRA